VSETLSRTDFVFDLAGVLVDWDPLHVYLEICGGDRREAQRFLSTVMGDE